MIRLTLVNHEQAHQAILNAWHGTIKPLLADGKRLTLTIAEETRNHDQNAKLHATLTDIAAQKEWAGQRWDVETWKRLLTAAWMRARGERVMLVPALDGMGVDVVFRRTSTLSKAEMSELIEFVLAWCAENGIKTADYA